MIKSLERAPWSWDTESFEMGRREEGSARQRKQHEQWHQDGKRRAMFREKQVGPVWCQLYINGRSRKHGEKPGEGLVIEGH